MCFNPIITVLLFSVHLLVHQSSPWTSINSWTESEIQDIRSTNKRLVAKCDRTHDMMTNSPSAKWNHCEWTDKQLFHSYDSWSKVSKVSRSQDWHQNWKHEWATSWQGKWGSDLCAFLTEIIILTILTSHVVMMVILKPQPCILCPRFNILIRWWQ